MNKLLILLSALALTFTLSTAEGNAPEAKCSGDKKEMKCGDGKCGGDAKKKMKCGDGKCGTSKKEMKCGEGKCGTTKKAPKKAKCGQGKCG